MTYTPTACEVGCVLPQFVNPWTVVSANEHWQTYHLVHGHDENCACPINKLNKKEAQNGKN